MLVIEEELERLCGKVSLTKGEKTRISVTEGEIAIVCSKGVNCLVGCLRVDRKANKEAFKTLMSRLWHTIGNVVFKELQDNLWLFEFADSDNKRRVIKGRPRSFDRQILVLKDFDGQVPYSQMDFSFSPF